MSDLGDDPKEVLSKRGLKPIIMFGFIEKGLEAIYTGKGLSILQGRMRKYSSKEECLVQEPVAGDGKRQGRQAFEPRGRIRFGRSNDKHADAVSA